MLVTLKPQKEYSDFHLKDALFVDTNTELSNTVQDPKFGGRHPLPSLEDFLYPNR